MAYDNLHSRNQELINLILKGLEKREEQRVKKAMALPIERVDNG